jgi:hypothetical protein
MRLGTGRHESLCREACVGYSRIPEDEPLPIMGTKKGFIQVPGSKGRKRYLRGQVPLDTRGVRAEPASLQPESVESRKEVVV